MYIVIGGGGKVAETLARRLLSDGHEVAVIEQQPERINHLASALKGRSMVVCGNCCESETLIEAGIEHADVLCAVTGQDDTNLAVCEISKTLFKIPRAVARVSNPRNERIFKNLDVAAVSSTSLVAQMIEEEILSSKISSLMSIHHGEFAIMEIEIPASSNLIAEGGIRVSDLELPPSTVLIARTRDEEFDTINGQTVLVPGDTVLVCAKSERADDARRALLDL